MKRQSGIIIIISGPSGSGKTTLHEKLLHDPRFRHILVKPVSYTTRQKRPGEKNGREYFFVSPRMFVYKKKAGHFLEAQKVFDHYYGTSFSQVRRVLAAGKHLLLCIDVKGAQVVRRALPRAHTFFITTPSLAELKKRLLARGSEDPHTVALRLAVARKELTYAGEYDRVIVNDELSRAYAELAQRVSESIHRSPACSQK